MDNIFLIVLSISGGMASAALTFFSLMLLLDFSIADFRRAFNLFRKSNNHKDEYEKYPIQLGCLVPMHMNKSDLVQHAVRELSTVGPDIPKNERPVIPIEQMHLFNCRIFLN